MGKIFFIMIYRDKKLDFMVSVEKSYFVSV